MGEIFRPKSNFIWAAIAYSLLGLFAANSLLVLRSSYQTFFELVICLGLGLLAYLAWVRPKMVLKSSSVHVINPLRNEEILYSDILELETKWALTIIHHGGKTRVWVAPASGKRRWIADKTFGMYGSSVPMSDQISNSSETMSASLDSLSGQAAHLIREKIKRMH